MLKFFYERRIKEYYVHYIIMMKITIDECVYNVHPIYDLYASDENGNVINIIKKVPRESTKNNSDYMLCGVRKHAQTGKKT